MNLSEAIRTWANRHGEKLALSGTNDITYLELNKAADEYSQSIKQFISNNSKSQRIAILENNSVDFISALLGIIRSGNVYVLINPNLSVEQINRSMDTIQCDYYVSTSPKTGIAAQCITLNTSFKSSDQIGQDYCFDNEIGIIEEAGIIFSSGTTGEPKALSRNSYSILSETIQWIIELQLVRDTRFLIPRPLYYTGGFILMYAALFSGGRVDLLEDISTDSVLEYVKSTPVDWAFLVPSVVRELNAKESCSLQINNVLTMGSPILYSEKTDFYEKYNCKIVEVWGNSEGLGTITEPSDIVVNPKTIGKPFFTDMLCITDNGRIVQDEEKGLLTGKSDNLFTEYIGKPELTNKVINNGLIYSEDIGYRNNDGFFYITGRATDIIVVDGLKVFPSDIEKQIMLSDSVSDCAVFATQDDYGNDIVTTALVLKDNTPSTIVINNINSFLAPHETIRKHYVVDSIPRNHGGKIDKNKLLSEINGSK